MATIVVTTSPTITGIRFLLAKSTGFTPHIAAAGASAQGTIHPPPTHVAAIWPKADKAPTFAPIAVPNTAAVEPAKDIPENDEPSSPVIPPTTVYILAAATLLKGTASDKTRPISPKSPWDPSARTSPNTVTKGISPI